jgi:hypothetical protein
VFVPPPEVKLPEIRASIVAFGTTSNVDGRAEGDVVAASGREFLLRIEHRV